MEYLIEKNNELMKLLLDERYKIGLLKRVISDLLLHKSKEIKSINPDLSDKRCKDIEELFNEIREQFFK